MPRPKARAAVPAPAAAPAPTGATRTSTASRRAGGSSAGTRRATPAAGKALAATAALERAARAKRPPTAAEARKLARSAATELARAPQPLDGRALTAALTALGALGALADTTCPADDKPRRDHLTALAELGAAVAALVACAPDAEPSDELLPALVASFHPVVTPSLRAPARALAGPAAPRWAATLEQLAQDQAAAAAPSTDGAATVARAGSERAEALAEAAASLWLAAGDHAALAALVARWPASFGVRRVALEALAAERGVDAAIEAAVALEVPGVSAAARAAACEALLRGAGRHAEACARFGLVAHAGPTHTATLRQLRRAYAELPATELLAICVAASPGQEGKWFAAAKDAELWDEAARLAATSPTDARTLLRAAQDHAEDRPAFAVEAALAGLHWLAEGDAFDPHPSLVWALYYAAVEAAAAAAMSDEVRARLRATVERDRTGLRVLHRTLARELGLR